MSSRLPRRVLMTADTVGGVWTYAIDLATELDRRGIHVAIATMGAPLSAAQREEVATLRRCTLYESLFKLEWMADPWRDVASAGDWLLGLEREFQPDIVHLNGYVHAALRWHAPRVVAAHTCVCSWYDAVHGCAAPPSYDRYRVAVRAGLRAADLVVMPTGAMYAALTRHYGRLQNTVVIGNGRAADGLRPAEKTALVLGAGRAWDPGTNLAALDRAAATVSWPVCIAGDLIAPDGRLVAFDHARSLGAVASTALAHAMSQASIFALPARYEPAGLSVLEAALCGCALVLGDIDSLRESWSDAALFVDPNDENGLGETLQWLIEHPHVRADFGARARAKAVDRTAAAMATAYLGCYRRVRAVAAA